jgi:hypothetical protein
MMLMTQAAAGQMPNFTCGCLLLVSEVLKVPPPPPPVLMLPAQHDNRTTCVLRSSKVLVQQLARNVPDWQTAASSGQQGL